jgi:hypothetical protein
MSKAEQRSWICVDDTGKRCGRSLSVDAGRGVVVVSTKDHGIATELPHLRRAWRKERGAAPLAHLGVRQSTQLARLTA